MSDTISADKPGVLMPDRDVETHRFRVNRPLPEKYGLPPVGGVFSCWAWGDVYLWVVNHGPILTDGELAAMERKHLVTRIDRAGKELPMRRGTLKEIVADDTKIRDKRAAR